MAGLSGMRESWARVRAATLVQWKLALRLPEARGGEKAAFWGMIVPMLGFVSLAMGLAGYMAASGTAREPWILNVVLLAFGGTLFFIFMVFILCLPFAEKTLSGFDTSALFHLPIRPGEILASLLLGNLLNPTVIMIPGAFFAGCVIGALSKGLLSLAACCFLAAALWLLQFALSMMAADFALIFIRRSWARWRLLLFLGLLAFFAFAAVLHASADETKPLAGRLRQLLPALWRKWEVLFVHMPGLSPVGWVSRGHGSWSILAAAILETAALFAIGAALLGRLTSLGGAESARRGKTAGKARAARAPSPLDRLALWPFLAKDLRLLLRERNLVITFASLTLVVLVVPQALHEDMGGKVEILLHWLAPIFVVWMMGSIAFNQLGLEGGGILLVLSSPTPRWRYLLGKNLAFLAVAFVILTAAEASLALLGSRGMEILADYLLAASFGLLYFGGGNFASVLWPYPSSLSGKTTGIKVGQARIMVISLCQFAVAMVIGSVAVPVLAGRLALSEFRGVAFAFVAAVMLLYGGIFYAAAVALAGALLTRTEPRVYEMLVRGRS